LCGARGWKGRIELRPVTRLMGLCSKCAAESGVGHGVQGAQPSSAVKVKPGVQRTRGRSSSPGAAAQRSPAAGGAMRAGSIKKARHGSAGRGRGGGATGEAEGRGESVKMNGFGRRGGKEHSNSASEDYSDGSLEGDDGASETSCPGVMLSSGADGSTSVPLPGAAQKEWRSSDFCILVRSGWRKEAGFRLFEIDASETKFPPAADVGDGCTLPAREWS
jgi:hypothetical protein